MIEIAVAVAISAVTAVLVTSRIHLRRRREAEARSWKEGFCSWQNFIELQVIAPPEGAAFSADELRRLRDTFTGGLLETAEAMEEFREENNLRMFELRLHTDKAKSVPTTLSWWAKSRTGINRRLVETLDEAIKEPVPLKQRWEKRFGR
jgi:hypothetical protein